MKTVIITLIRKYFGHGLTVKETVIIGRGNNQMVRMVENRTSVVMEITKGGEYSEEERKKLQSDDKEMIANQLYMIMLQYLISQKLFEQAQREDPRRKLQSHEEKMAWCLYHIFRLNILSPHEIIQEVTELDKEGDLLGYRDMVEMGKGKLGEAYQDLGDRMEEFDEG